MSNDDLFKGFAIFQQGLNQYHIGQAVQSANKKLTELNQMQMDEQERLQAQTAIQNDLTMRLGAAGADASKIQALAGNLAPSSNAQFQAGENRDLQASSQSFQSGESAKQRAHDREMQQMKLDSMGLKDSPKQRKFLIEQGEKFYKREQKNIEAIDTLGSLKDLIDKNPSQIGIELGKTALLKAVGEDRISDADINRAANDPSIRQTIKKKLQLEVSGTALKDDRKFYSALMNKLEQDALNRMDSKVKGQAQSLKDVDPDIDSEGFEKSLRSRIPSFGRLEKKQQQEANQRKVQALEGWLRGPDAKDPKNAERKQKIMDALAKLKGQ